MEEGNDNATDFGLKWKPAEPSDPMKARKTKRRYQTTDLITGEKRTVIVGPEVRRVSEDGIVTFQASVLAMYDEKGNEIDPRKMPPIGYDETYVLTITVDGYATMVPSYNFTRKGRGSSGVVNVINRKVAAVVTCTLRDEVVVAGDKGTLLRTKVANIRRTNRQSPGNRLITLREGEWVASASVVVEA